MITASAETNTDEQFRVATQRAAVFLSDAGLLKLTGEDARDLLNRLSTNLVDPKGAPGEVVATALTSDRGRIVDLVYVAHRGDHQIMITSPGQQQNVIDFLDKYTIMEDLEVEDVTGATAMVTATGPAAHEIIDRAQPIDAIRVNLPANPDDATLPPTCHLLCSDHAAANSVLAALESAGAARVSAATAEALRIANGLPAFGSEMGDTYNPLEAGLIGAIDFHKGCYIGQEVIARLDTYQKVQKYLVTLRFDAPASGVPGSGLSGIEALEVATDLPGARLTNEAGDVMGVVTSATVAPDPVGSNLIGLGYVRTGAAQIGERLNVAAPDDSGYGITAIITAQPLLFGGERPAPSR